MHCFNICHSIFITVFVITPKQTRCIGLNQFRFLLLCFIFDFLLLYQVPLLVILCFYPFLVIFYKFNQYLVLHVFNSYLLSHFPLEFFCPLFTPNSFQWLPKNHTPPQCRCMERTFPERTLDEPRSPDDLSPLHWGRWIHVSTQGFHTKKWKRFLLCLSTQGRTKIKLIAKLLIGLSLMGLIQLGIGKLKSRSSFKSAIFDQNFDLWSIVDFIIRKSMLANNLASPQMTKYQCPRFSGSGAQMKLSMIFPCLLIWPK